MGIIEVFLLSPFSKTGGDIVDVYFNAYKIKYNRLNAFFKPIVTSQIVKNITIYVNIDDLFHNLHKPIVNNVFQVTGANAAIQLTSNVFNVLGHYRNWAIKEGLNPIVVGYYTSTMRSFKNNIHVINYRKRFKELNDDASGEYYFINQAIKSSYSNMQIISNYIPNVYIIDSKYLEPCIIPRYLSQEVFKSDWNILISRDSYDLQYAYKDKWSLIAPKGDNSMFINKKNMWNYLNIKEKIYKDPVELVYDPDLYILSKSIVGDTYRNIPRLRKIGWKTLFKYLDKMVEENHQSKIVSKSALIELLKNKSISNDEINNNIYSIDVDTQVNAMMEIDKTSILSQIKDIPDDEGLKNVNNKYFTDFPLNLQFLRNQSYKHSPFN